MPGTPTASRPPRRTTFTTPAAPTGQLPPQPASWGRQATGWTAAGLAGYGAAPLSDRPALALPALAAGGLGALWSAVHGRRLHARRQLRDRLVEALAPQLGTRSSLDRASVQLRSWTGGWPGAPRTVELRYAPGVDDNDPSWLPTVREVLHRRLQTDYELHRHDRRRCRLSLRRSPPQDDQPDPPAVQLRAERAISELLGPTATVTGLDWADQELAGVDVAHQAGTKLSAAGYRHRIERVVSTMLPGRWRARWDLEADTVRFELRRVLPHRVPHPPPELTAATRFRIPLAVDEDGDTVTWHLRGTGPHLLVIGKTGLGKTVLMNGVVMELTARDWPVWICDPKRIEFLGMRDWPNVQVVATTVPDQVVVIYQAWQQMESRYELIESGEAVEDDFEPLILVLDEYRDFYGIVAEWYAGIKVTGMPARCPVLEKIGSIVRKGRSARVHVVLGLQRPDADILSGEMRDNFGTRISLGPLSPQGAIMMWEAPHIGVSLPRGVAGRATAVSDEAQPLEVQAYWTPDPRRAQHSADPADLQLLAQLHPQQHTHQRLQVQLDHELMSTPDEKGRSQQWQAVLGGQLVPVEQHVQAATAPPATTDRMPPAPALALVPPPSSPDPVELQADESAEAALADGVLDEEDLLDGFEQLEVPARAVQPGDLVLVNDSPPAWARVEACEPDLDDPELLCVDWRDDDDEHGSLLLTDDNLVSVRRDPVSPAAAALAGTWVG